MSAVNDGGPAFPIGSGDMRDPTGITMRDYFAAKFAPEILRSIDDVDRDILLREIARTGVKGAYGLVALRSYEAADAMIAERAKAGNQ